MEPVWQSLAVAALVLTCAAAWFATLLGLPGNWLMAGATALYAWLGPSASRLAIGWQPVVAILVLALLGEILETVTGVVGARRAGGSRRAAVFSLVGSIAGAVAGATFGLPVPVLGSAVGSILGGALGAFGGAMLAETSLGEHHQQSFRVGKAAFWGRLLGTGAKSILASINLVIVLAALCT